MKRIGCATAIAAVLAAPGMASAQSGTLTYRYDDNGRLVVMSSSSAGASTAYGYDAVDNRTRVITNSGNLPPLPMQDEFSVATSGQTSLPVLTNDIDPNNNTLTITAATGATKGTLAILSGTAVGYTPNAGATGNDSFRYTVSDGTVSVADTRVIVHIGNATGGMEGPGNGGGNQNPYAGDDSISTYFNTPVTVYNLLSNDTDPNPGQTLSMTGVSTATKGTVSRTGNTVTYTPYATSMGPDSFTYTVSDGNGGTATATVAVTIINRNPTPSPDTMTVPRNSFLTINPLSNDSDPDPGQSLTVTGVTTPQKGTAAYTANSITYTHANGGPTGGDVFYYTISDGYGGTATGTANVSIFVPNTLPTAVNDYVSVPNNTAVNIAPFENDTDPDPGQQATLSLHSWTNPSKGSIWWDENNYGIIYQPFNASQTGADSFTYQVKDTAGGFATGTVYLTIASGNSPPVANNDTAGVAYMTATSINVMYNDTDPDGTSTMRVNSAWGASKGTVSVAGNGLSVIYTSNSGQTGPDTFYYNVRDGSNAVSNTASVAVTINSPNPPDAVDDYTPVNGSTPTAINVLANDTTPGGTSLSIASFTQPQYGTLQWSGGTVTYTYNGPHNATSDSFQYTVTNGSGTDTATVYFAVTGGPTTAPIAEDDGYPPYTPITVARAGTGMNYFILGNDTLPQGTIIYSVTQGQKGNVVLTPPNPQFPGDRGQIGYTPYSWAQPGELDYFTYTLKNGAYTESAFVQVYIAN